MENTKVEVLNIDDLVPYPGNPMKHPDDQIRLLVDGIRKYGFRQPILVDENRVIITGHGRLQAAKAAGLTTVPVIFARGMSEADVRAYRVADNKLARKSSWDIEALSKEISDLADLDFDLSLTGMSDDEIEMMVNPTSRAPLRAA